MTRNVAWGEAFPNPNIACKPAGTLGFAFRSPQPANTWRRKWGVPWHAREAEPSLREGAHPSTRTYLDTVTWRLSRNVTYCNANVRRFKKTRVTRALPSSYVEGRGPAFPVAPHSQPRHRASITLTGRNTMSKRDMPHIRRENMARHMLHSSVTNRGRRGELRLQGGYMEQIVECLIAGGPQHGVVRRQLWDPRHPLTPALAAGDGKVCTAAARRPAGPYSNRFLLLHPQATGQQILAMMAMLVVRNTIHASSSN